ncbi:GH1 family beta-glucosidase [Cohnella silvisoli]|uniref:Beta-glucosidase n=1 Tax=Cohnella silvisoli TaxID=2873699 RepID=A0ABV1KNF0_9BACL|nr:GH1 family beta-glucosidase [Cohnella silvisoli]MCD9020198.1 beta-glucosidase [Cohnella silvisoli]
MGDSKKFPDSFVWGVAASSYQIEGAADRDGRTPSIWDTFSETPGKVYGGHTGALACEHYVRYPEDVRLMAQLGVKHYRFSVSWSRIFPEKGVLNERGLAFYRSLLEEMEKHGITPLLTLYHWDLPQWIQDEGGWVNRNTIDYYLDYARVMFATFGADVPIWNTINEPWCAAILGYGVGVHAPGHTNWREAIVAAHHLLLASGLAIREYRKFGLTGRIGITLNLDHNDSATEDERDEAARRRHDGHLNRWFLDPLYKEDYPEDMKAWYHPRIGEFDFIVPGDMEIIGEPGDFLGVNYYTRTVIREGNDHPVLLTEQVVQEGCEVTDMGWEVHPESLFKLLCRIRDDYADIPIYITENGAAQDDHMVDGKIEDADRIRYLQAHLEQALRFIRIGGNLQGYYLWSFLDNFEWAYGYGKRFGIIHVDFGTQIRTPKQSAYWYRNVMLAGGLPGSD